MVAAPAGGVYRFRFEIWHHPAVYSPSEALASATPMQEYQVPLHLPPRRIDTPPADTAADAPPWPERQRDGPHFPEGLRDLGVEGGALMQFVVDTTGAVDAASVRVMQATAPEIGASVREFLGRARFAPARRDHRPVCALLVQPFLFQLRR